MWIPKQMSRKKCIKTTVDLQSPLAKVLGTIDLTALGVGCTLGVGIFVLPGVVAKQVAGPAVIISFLIAAITSIFAGLCYAEFGARVPKAGSAYIYSYVTVGEFVGFIIGWCLIMEYIIGSASVARGLSIYLDSMFDKKMEMFYRGVYEFQETSFISEYFDIFAFIISLTVTICLATGLKESMTLNNILTSINILVVVFVIIVGSFKADLNNWTIPQSDVPVTAGKGGFLPFGLLGAIKGAATCFFGYVGFDCISASGEEVKNPSKSIPIAIIASLAIAFIAYSGVSAVLTLMWPYYLQDEEAPIPYVFDQIGWPWAKWIVAIGGIFGLLASLVSGLFPLPRIIYAMADDGLLFKVFSKVHPKYNTPFIGTIVAGLITEALFGLFPLPRIIYAMADDGLLFKVFSKVHPKYNTPFIGTIVAGLITGIMAAAFKLKHLVDLMSIATLLAYTIVAACVLLLRYRNDSNPEDVSLLEDCNETSTDYLLQLFNSKCKLIPSRLSSNIVIAQTIFYCILCTILSIITVYFENELLDGNVTLNTICFILICVMGVSLISINTQPSSDTKLSFKVPFVPLLPSLSILFNIYLMILMDLDTWIRFSCCLAFGILIYFTYSINHSGERLAYKLNRRNQYTTL